MALKFDINQSEKATDSWRWMNLGLEFVCLK